MKKIILALMAAITIAATIASAQVGPIYANQTLVSHVAVLGSAQTNLGVVIDCRKQAKVTLQITTTNSAPDAVSKNTLYYIRSLDGTSYETTTNIAACQVAWNPNTNAVPQVIITNLDTYGCGYIKLSYLTNAGGSGTNIGDVNISYGIKIGAP